METIAAGLARQVITNRGPPCSCTGDGYRPTPGSRARPRNPVAARYDEPTVRHLRRGATTDALASLRLVGAVSFVIAPQQVRYARPAATPSASLRSTWNYFHDDPFAHAAPPVPLLHYATDPRNDRSPLALPALEGSEVALTSLYP